MKKKLFLIGFTFIFILTACSPAAGVQPPAAAISTATLAAASTSTLAPTEIPSATPTLEPSATVTPTPTVAPPVKVSSVLDGAAVTLYDPLTKTRPDGWNLGGGASATGTEIRLAGATSWSSSFERQNKFAPGSGMIISYQYSKQSEFEIFFDVGQWAHPDYRRFGVYPGAPSADLFQGANGLGFNYIAGNFTPAPTTWYTILMAVGKGGDFLILIWENGKPEHVARYREVIKNWDSTTSWHLAFGANKGIIDYKDYMEVSFNGFKK